MRVLVLEASRGEQARLGTDKGIMVTCSTTPAGKAPLALCPRSHLAEQECRQFV